MPAVDGTRQSRASVIVNPQTSTIRLKATSLSSSLHSACLLSWHQDKALAGGLVEFRNRCNGDICIGLPLMTGLAVRFAALGCPNLQYNTEARRVYQGDTATSGAHMPIALVR